MELKVGNCVALGLCRFSLMLYEECSWKLSRIRSAGLWVITGWGWQGFYSEWQWNVRSTPNQRRILNLFAGLVQILAEGVWGCVKTKYGKYLCMVFQSTKAKSIFSVGLGVFFFWGGRRESVAKMKKNTRLWAWGVPIANFKFFTFWKRESYIDC